MVQVESRFARETEHLSRPIADRKLMCAGYSVRWGRYKSETLESPLATLKLNLATKSLIAFQLNDASLLHPGHAEIPDALALNALPDAPVYQWMRAVANPFHRMHKFLQAAGDSLLDVIEALTPQLLKDAERVVTTLQWKSPAPEFSDMVEEVYVISSHVQA